MFHRRTLQSNASCVIKWSCISIRSTSTSLFLSNYFMIIRFYYVANLSTLISSQDEKLPRHNQLNVSKGLITRSRRRRAGRLFKDFASLRANARASDVKRRLHLPSPFILGMHWNRNYVTMDGREHESVGGQPGMTIDLSPKIFALSLSEINGVVHDRGLLHIRRKIIAIRNLFEWPEKKIRRILFHLLSSNLTPCKSQFLITTFILSFISLFYFRDIIRNYSRKI